MNLTWRRFLLLLIYIPLAAIKHLVDWLMDLVYAPLYRENTRIMEARRQAALAKRNGSTVSGDSLA